MASSSTAGSNRVLLTVKDLGIIAAFAALLFVQEEALTVLPNIQLTVFLIVLYSKKLGFIKTTLIVTIHVILDNLFMGSFNFVWVPFMWLGWMIIPLVICSVGRKINNCVVLAILGAVFALTYSWCFIIPTVFIYHMDFKAYFIADIPFEGILAASSFLSILLLYVPCSKAIDRINNKDISDDPMEDES